MNRKDLDVIQEQIGYHFKNLDLLQQAFIRRSYSKENGGGNNEVLEFIGDKVLDFIVVKMLTERFGYFSRDCDDFDSYEDCDEFISDYQENELTELKRKLVEKKNLAHQIDLLDLAEYLIMGKGDIKCRVEREMSVKEDLFEAIIGAVAIDSKWNIAEIQSTVEIMLNPDACLNEEADENYVELIQEWSLREYGKVPEFYYKEFVPGWCSVYEEQNEFSSNLKCDDRFSCEMKLIEQSRPFKGYGESKSEARKAVCKKAYIYLENHDLLFSILDEIDCPNKAEAINQLEILARRGYFSIPEYKFQHKYDCNGNPVWKCTCYIDEAERYFKAESSTKKDAKKTAAFAMLEYVLEEYES